MSRALLLFVVGLALAACDSGEGVQGAVPAAPAASATSATPSQAAPRVEPAVNEWVDPEPPGAQRRAEEVVHADWNEDKTIRLTMHLTTLVNRQSAIGGATGRLAGREVNVEDRLDRLGAEVTEAEIVIRLPGAILFDFDKADIRPDAERTLAEVAAVLDAYQDRPARIEGHTDSIASESYNLALSQRRAEAVRDWLVGRGVAARRLRTTGLGESQPVADNGTAAGRRSNRRVEVVVERAR